MNGRDNWGKPAKYVTKEWNVESDKFQLKWVPFREFPLPNKNYFIAIFLAPKFLKWAPSILDVPFCIVYT
jgi:hypothetical protein